MLHDCRTSAFTPGTSWQLSKPIPVLDTRHQGRLSSRKRNTISNSRLRYQSVDDITLPKFGNDTSFASTTLLGSEESSDAFLGTNIDHDFLSNQDWIEQQIVMTAPPMLDDTTFSSDEKDQDSLSRTTKTQPTTSSSSTKEMLSFAIPALGIFLASPLLSNIDNAFVGQASGAAGLAALSPATICTDQALYLFTCLSSATTNAVSRVTGGNDGNIDHKAVRQAASAPLTAAIVTGLVLSLSYALFTPHLLSLLKVPSDLHAASSSYIYWRGAASAPALAQSVALSVLLATRDAVTPLLIVAAGVAVNIIGDAGLCLWPFRLGCGGAAAASAVSALVSCGLMVKVLAKRHLLPEVRIPGKEEWKSMNEYCTPLFAITMMRFMAFAAAQCRAVSLGITTSAAYQISVNTVLFFLLFGEPLSQLSQTTLPPLIDRRDKSGLRAALSSVLRLSTMAALAVGGVALGSLLHGAGLFSTDPAVVALVKQSAPSVFALVTTGVLYYAIDGAAFASRDFGFVSTVAILTSIMQLALLPFCTTIPAIFGTFTLRFGAFTLAAVVRTLFGKGTLGKITGGWGLGRKQVATPQYAAASFS